MNDLDYISLQRDFEAKRKILQNEFNDFFEPYFTKYGITTSRIRSEIGKLEVDREGTDGYERTTIETKLRTLKQERNKIIDEVTTDFENKFPGIKFLRKYDEFNTVNGYFDQLDKLKNEGYKLVKSGDNSIIPLNTLTRKITNLLSSSKIMQNTETYIHSDEKLIKSIIESKNQLITYEKQQLENLMDQVLDKTSESTYLAPGLNPSDFEFRKKGKWNYIDHANFTEESEEVNEKILLTSRSGIKNFTLNTKTTPFEKGSQDVVFYNQDYLCDCCGNTEPVSTITAANLVKKGGLVITKTISDRFLQKIAPELELIGQYKHLGYSAYQKRA